MAIITKRKSVAFSLFFSQYIFFHKWKQKLILLLKLTGVKLTFQHPFQHFTLFLGYILATF